MLASVGCGIFRVFILYVVVDFHKFCIVPLCRISFLGVECDLTVFERGCEHLGDLSFQLFCVSGHEQHSGLAFVYQFGDAADPGAQNGCAQALRFDDGKRVVLIPFRGEYAEPCLTDNLLYLVPLSVSE